MPPSPASTLWRRSEGLTKIQRFLRRSFAKACAVDTVSRNKIEAVLGSNKTTESRRHLHADSNGGSSSTPSENPLLDVAQSLEYRLKLLQQEHIDSQLLHRSSHADHHRAHEMVHGDQDRLNQKHLQAQWARYQEHRAAADQYAVQRQAGLHDAPLESSLSSGSDTWEDESDDEECKGKMMQLRKLLDSPLLSESESMALQEEVAAFSEEAGQDGSTLREPDAPHAKTQPAPRTTQHTNMGPRIMSGVLQSTRQAEAVPTHSQQLLQTGIIGVPNSGKSTLTNALVGQKVTAVSDKTNTTGAARLGAFTEGSSQVALYDTPGVVHTRSLHGPRHARSVRSAWGTASQCDMLMCIVDAHRQILKPDIRVYGLVEELASGPLPSWEPLPTVLILNKVDLLSKEQGAPLLQLRDRFLQLFPFQDVFCISARHGAGVQELKQYLLERCKPGRWIVGSWEATDMGPSDIATEIVRENLFKRLYKEVPYNLEIVDVSVKYLRDGSLRIEKHIMVATELIRAIVVGTKGAVIGEVGIAARKTLETVLAKRVHLILNVKTSPH